MMKESSPLSCAKLYFIPRDLQFWSYHIAGLALFILVELVLSAILAEKPRIPLFELISFTVWALCFTISVLVIRYKYTQWANRSWTTLKFVSHILVLVAALALSLFLMLAITAMTPFWDQLMAQELAVNPDQTTKGYFTKLLVGNWFSGSIILSCWLLIYVGISKSREIKKSMLANLRLQNSLKEAQLSSLSNQLNPHFLFNSLNNIRFMIHENADQADKMITSLSQVLRYSLESSQHEKLPLRKELDIIDRYVEIVSIQFEDRFRFNMNIPKEMHDCLIPPMLIQMLIENGVKHGVEQLTTGGSIVVNAKSDNDLLHIEVCNDAPSGASLNASGTGIGLENIEQRLNILYGQAAQFKAKLEDDQFRVLISLPIEEHRAGVQ